jgi:hypothetical protein
VAQQWLSAAQRRKRNHQWLGWRSVSEKRKRINPAWARNEAESLSEKRLGEK